MPRYNGSFDDDNVEERRERIAKAFFGRSRKEEQCVMCGSNKMKNADFRDKLSIKERNISRMCQCCQDQVFGTDNEDYE